MHHEAWIHTPHCRGVPPRPTSHHHHHHRPPLCCGSTRRGPAVSAASGAGGSQSGERVFERCLSSSESCRRPRVGSSLFIRGRPGVLHWSTAGFGRLEGLQLLLLQRLRPGPRPSQRESLPLTDERRDDVRTTGSRSVAQKPRPLHSGCDDLMLRSTNAGTCFPEQRRCCRSSCVVALRRVGCVRATSG